MIYITGDMHGKFKRLRDFCKERELTEEDTIIVLGDLGANYFGNDRDLQSKKLIKKLKPTIFSIHGNHDMRPESIPTYAEIEFRGGTAYAEPLYPNLIFAKDGEFYDFDGIEAFVCGGAYTLDKDRRLANGWSWFADEQPSTETKALVEQRLGERDWKVDVMLTHTGPLKFEPAELLLDFVDQSTVDKSTEIWLDSIEDRLDYNRWYFAHYHGEKVMEKVQILFQNFDAFRR